MSGRALGRAMGLDSAAVSLMLRGRREMRISEAVEIARLLGRPAEEVMEAAGVQIASNFKQVAISGYIDGHGESHCLGEEQMQTVAHPGGDLPEDVIAIQCRTANSELDYMDGWILFCAPIKEGVPADAIARLSLCKIRDGVVYLARPARAYQRNRWDISGPAAVASNVVLDWATPVLQIAT